MYMDLIDPLPSNSMSFHDRVNWVMTHQANVKTGYHDHIVYC